MGEQASIGEFTAEASGADKTEGVRLKHLARINPTKSEVSDLDPDTEVSFVALEDFGTDGEIKDTETRALKDVYDGYTYFREGDIAIAKITPSFENGKGAVCRGLKNEIGFGTTELHILRPREGVCTEYLWYVLRSKPFIDEAETAMRGVAGQQRVPTEFLKNYRISNSPHRNQIRISSYLSDQIPKLRSLVDSKKRLLDRLEEREQRVTTKAVTTGINKDLIETEGKNELFSKIPSNWKVIRLKFLVDRVEQGWSPKCKDNPAGKDQWGVLKAGAVNGGTFDSSENKTLPPETDPRKEYVINKGDVLMNRASGSKDLLGSVAIVRDASKKLILCDKLYRLHARVDMIAPEFLTFALQSHPSRHQIRGMVSGAEGLANNIPQSDLKNLEIVVPPKNEQKEIVDYVRGQKEVIRSCRSNAEESIERLREKRLALITVAVTGKAPKSISQDKTENHI